MGYEHISDFVWIFISPLSLFIVVILFSMNLGKNGDRPQETKYPRVSLCHKIVSTRCVEWQRYEMMKGAIFIENSLLSHLSPAVGQEHSGLGREGPGGAREFSQCCNGMALCSLGLTGVYAPLLSHITG